MITATTIKTTTTPADIPTHKLVLFDEDLFFCWPEVIGILYSALLMKTTRKWKSLLDILTGTFSC